MSETITQEKQSPLIAGAGNYRVYKDAVDFTIVKASNVLEALKTSGLPQVYKVERYDLGQETLLTADMMNSLLGPKPAASAEPAAVAPVEAAPAAEAPKS